MFGLTILCLLVFCTGSAHADLVWLILRDKVTPDGQVIIWDFSRSIHDVAEQDLPVRKDYINKIEKIGVRVRISSRWINAVSVNATNYQQIELSKLKFIKTIMSFMITRIKQNNLNLTTKNSFNIIHRFKILIIRIIYSTIFY